MTQGYPKRDSHFAHKAVRLLFKSCSIMEIGHHAAVLVIHVAHTEDAARYQAPVKFWNSQLMETLGFSSPKQLNNARKKAVEAGWLHYERAGHRSEGRYWVLVPESVQKHDDLPIEESPIHSPGGTNNGTDESAIHSPTGTNEPSIHSQLGTNGSTIHSQLGTKSGTNSGMKSGKLPNPGPNPNPKKVCTTVFKPPEVEEVQSYCQERGNDIDAEHFVDYHIARGWKLKSGQKMKDWKATVRTWEKNQQRSNKTSGLIRSGEYDYD